jgi:hypothetical protein
MCVRYLAIVEILVISVIVACVSKPPLDSPVLMESCSLQQEGLERVLTPDPSKVAAEELLLAYLRASSDQSSACHQKPALFWQRFFNYYGIEHELISMPFGGNSTSIAARVRRNGVASKAGRSLVFLNHVGVHGVSDQPQTLSRSVFIKDQYVYGQGVTGAATTTVLHALLLAKASRLNWIINRDVIFLGVDDGPGSDDQVARLTAGSDWILKHHRRLLGHAEFMITAGGVIPVVDGLQQRWEVSTAEKSRLELTLKAKPTLKDPSAARVAVAKAAARLTSGFSRPLLLETRVEVNDEDHPSTEALDDVVTESETINTTPALLSDPAIRANYETTHALTRLGGWGQPMIVPAHARASLLFIGGAARRTAVEAAVMRGLLSGVGVAEIRQVSENLRVVLRASGSRSHAATPPVNGGASALLVHSLVRIFDRVATKEIPVKSVEVEHLASESVVTGAERAEASIDFRLLPDESVARVIGDVKALVAEFPVDVSVSGSPLLAAESPSQTDLFDAIALQHDHFTARMRSRPALETPIVFHTSAASLFRKKGIIVYGFDPLPVDWTQSQNDGGPERLPVASLQFASSVTEAYAADFLRRPVSRAPASVRRE